MKKLVSSILFLFIASSLYAIDLSSLTPEQLNTYNHEALFVNIGSVTEIEGKTAERETSLFGGKGTISVTTLSSAKTKQVWQPYRGPEKITKYDFFRISNNEIEAIKVKNAIDSNNRFKTMGYAMIGVSSAAIIGGAVYLYVGKKNNLSSEHAIAGYTIAGVGLLGALLSYIPLKYLQINIDDLFNVNFAVSIADGYNARLLKSIAGNAQ